MKKSLLIAACLIVSFVVLMTGCSKKSGGAAAPAAAVKRAAGEVVDPLKQTEKMPLTVATQTGYILSDSRTEKWLEERYNLDITLVVLPGAQDLAAKVSLIMADTKERPNIIWWNSSSEADFAKWEKANLLVELTPWVTKYHTMWDYYNGQDPRIMFYASSAGNKIFRIPGDVAELGCETMWLRKDWMDNLGLSAPKTMTDLEDMLRAFTFKDPDKNGKNDTLGWSAQNDLRCFWPWIQGSGNGNGNMYLTFTWMPDGKIDYAAQTDDAKLWLTRVAKLMQEGVIDPNVANNSNFGEVVARGGYGAMYRWAAWNNQATWTSLKTLRQTDPNAQWVAYDVPAGDNKDPQEDPGMLSAWCFFAITNTASDPERLYATWDDMGKPEPYVIKRFGIEGKEYTTNADGSHTILISSGSSENQAQNIGLDLFHDLFARKDFCNYGNTPATVALFEKVSKNSRGAYDLGFERKDPAMYTKWIQYGSEIQDARDEYFWSAIGGNVNTTTDWDAYKAQLKTIGIDEVLEEVNRLAPVQKDEMNAYMKANGFPTY